jgi:Trk K+ transport system NAD-binding subunit
MRALGRYIVTLWREFNAAIIGFLIATIGGGLLYSEVHRLVRDEPIPLVDAPYMMVQLMTLQGIAEERVPAEPELVLFWYVMPLIFIVLVGRGAADFVRLFFNLGENVAAWEEAVASTYRNHVIVVGIGGHVGLRVTRQVIALGYEVVGVDVKIVSERGSELRKLGVPVVTADARQMETLENAGIERAAAIVICTSNDQTNFETAMRARGMRKDVRIVVRQWDSQFAEHLQQFVDSVFSVSDIAAPVFAGAAAGVEIAPSLHVGNDDYSMVRIQVEPGTFLDGGTVEQLQNQYEMDIVLHAHNGSPVVHPDGDTVVRAGDTVIIFARHAHVTALSAKARRKG